MNHALRLAQRGLGNVSENPAVGCVIVNNERIVGRGWTQHGGRPHAETIAINQAGKWAHDSDVFVTLEPCSHYGQTYSCAQNLIDAGVSKVWVALSDPDLRVNGQGINMLRNAGIVVEYGLCLFEALFLNQGYIMRQTINRPLIVGKIATSQDGALALANQQSQWITSSMARRHMQYMRITFDAIITGIGTVLADNPSMTCRLPGLEHRLSLRVVIDSNLQINTKHQLVTQAKDHPLLVYTSHYQHKKHKNIDALSQKNVEIVGVEYENVDRPECGLNISLILLDLAQRGINQVILEAGSTLMSSFLRARLIDRLLWYRGTSLLGGDAMPFVDALKLKKLDDAPELHSVNRTTFNCDECNYYIVQYVA